MKAYISYFKLKFMTNLQYRQAAIAGIVTQFFFGLVYIMVYVAFYESGGKNIPMQLPQLVTYVWLSQSFFSLINHFYKDPELYNLIRDGAISYELVRPRNLYFMWYFKILGQRLANVTLRFFPLLLITIFLPYPYNFNFPNSFLTFSIALLSLTVGSLIICSMSVLYPILTLLTMNEKGIVNIFIVIGDILSGVIVPIPFFPIILRKVSTFLPYQYVSDLPFRIFVGNISITQGLFGILIQFVWLIIFIILGLYLMNRNIRRVVVQGG